MSGLHVISDDLLDKISIAIAAGRRWFAYNDIPYFLEKGDVQSFKNRDEATEYAYNNISEYEDYLVIKADSILDVYRQIAYDHILLNKKLNQMNEQNLEYLKNNIKYLGFGEKLFTDLEKNFTQGKSAFTINADAVFNKDKLNATLHFRKSDNSDMYFLNKYDARLEKPGQEPLNQTFYLDKGKGITMKEAYNLLDGRSVSKDLTNKEGEKYQAWVQLDFKEKDQNENFKVKQFHENYGFDVKAQVENLVLSDYSIEKENQLIKSLEKGNVQSVGLLDRNNNEIKVYIEANPQFKTLNISDNNLNPLTKDQKAELLIYPDISERKTQSQLNVSGSNNDKESLRENAHNKQINHKTNAAQENSAQDIVGKKEQRVNSNEQKSDKEIKSGKRNSKELSQNNSESLLPKKRSSQDKGMKLS